MTKIRHELAYQFKYAKGVRRMILIEKKKKDVEILKVTLLQWGLEGSAALGVYAGSEPYHKITAAKHQLMSR